MVSLAVQTLSNSVAATLELLHTYAMVDQVQWTVHLLNVSSVIQVYKKAVIIKYRHRLNTGL